MGENDPQDEGDDKKSGIGKRLLGLFVEREGQEGASGDEPAADPDASPAARVAAIAAAAPAAPVAQAAAAVQGAAATGAAGEGRPAPPQGYKTPDFSGVLKTAGLGDEERDRLSKAEELLKNLPPETPLALKRQIVEGTLRTFGIAPERIVQASARAVEALGTYLRIGEDDLRTRTETTNKRLNELRAEQERLTRALAERQAMQQTLAWDVSTRQRELKAVADFFGGAQPPPTKG